MNTANQTLEQLLVRALDALTHNDASLWAEMFREDGVMEFPFAPAGFPKRVEGKENIAAYLARFPQMIQLNHVSHPTFHHCDNVLVAEFTVDGTAVQTGKAYCQQYVSVVEHRDGQLVRYVDYWNPLVVIEALGTDAPA